VYHNPNYGPTFGGNSDPNYVSIYGGAGPDLCTASPAQTQSDSKTYSLSLSFSLSFPPGSQAWWTTAT
jgi:hypothetical protein